MKMMRKTEGDRLVIMGLVLDKIATSKQIEVELMGKGLLFNQIDMIFQAKNTLEISVFFASLHEWGWGGLSNSQ